MPAGSGHFKTTLNVFLPLDFAEVGLWGKRHVFDFQAGVDWDGLASSQVVEQHS
jgi:hypothetical protein